MIVPETPAHLAVSSNTTAITVVVILIVGIFALLVVSLQQASEALQESHTTRNELTVLVQARTEEALHRAQEALAAAANARPDPYTGEHAREDVERAAATRRMEQDVLRESFDHQLHLAEARLTIQLKDLEIPPPSVQDALKDLGNRMVRNEKAILILLHAVDQIKPGATRVPGLVIGYPPVR